jgi:hypothetical protein
MHIERKKNLRCGSSFVYRTSTISLIPYFNKKKLSCTKCFRLFISAARNTEKKEVNAKRGVDRQFFHVMSMHVFFSFNGIVQLSKLTMLLVNASVTCF